MHQKMDVALSEPRGRTFAHRPRKFCIGWPCDTLGIARFAQIRKTGSLRAPALQPQWLARCLRCHSASAHEARDSGGA